MPKLTPRQVTVHDMVRQATLRRVFRHNVAARCQPRQAAWDPVATSREKPRRGGPNPSERFASIQGWSWLRTGCAHWSAWKCQAERHAGRATARVVAHQALRQQEGKKEPAGQSFLESFLEIVDSWKYPLPGGRRVPTLILAVANLGSHPPLPSAQLASSFTGLFHTHA